MCIYTCVFLCTHGLNMHQWIAYTRAVRKSSSHVKWKIWELLSDKKRPQLWTTGDWRLHHNNVPAYVSRLVYSFLWKHLITLATQPPLQPRFGALRLLAFSKTKITFEWDWGVIFLCTVFLVSYIFFDKCLYFAYYMAGYFSALV